MDVPPYGKDKPGLELLAASARADMGDLRIFLNVLATKLSDMLPGHVVVERDEGIFRRRQSVRALRIRLDHRVYELEWTGTDLEARLAHEVRGVLAKPQTVQLNEWATDLRHHLGERARRATRARDALSRLLT
jgi:hypothetical protein